MAENHGKEEVVERPDDFHIDVPSDDDDNNANINIIEPFKLKAGLSVNSKSSLLILNQEINMPWVTFIKIWNSTSLHVCADGGSNRLLAYINKFANSTHDDDCKKFKPDYIVGDLDSITDKTRKFYSDMKEEVKILLQETQYSTDLMKSLSLINLHFNFHKELINSLKEFDEHDGIEKLNKNLNKNLGFEKLSLIDVYILGGIGGRFDQTIHSINQLYHISSYYHNKLHLTFFNRDFEDLVLLIPKGLNFVKIHKQQIGSKKNAKHNRVVGLLPIGKEVIINTKGLKYDVTNWKSSIDSKVSTNNLIAGDNGFEMECTEDIVINFQIFDNDFA
ncbi:hypothetical protein PACTADRAFT_49220 [Pachysolen tannophilus NRRL Y-2460]|uniref:Thiamine pyrophosphokinase n=1 Tax=Pachysolen tannophilus NRRL Y-2460 TaxID=669874 RepID=A0A1E4TVS9_PACTA|nr:hypothetical protein PACTADRAFT_49220 [Pachysolen tannophilus NRRL Y-2460]